ncbi:MAG: hypothetical protein ACXVJT_11700, partial [Thermoanaerobaculia bacterium]
GTPIDNSPNHLLKVRLSTSPSARIHAGLQSTFESARRTRDGGTTPSFVLLDGTLSTRVAKSVRLGLTVHNLLGTRYATPVGVEFRQESILQDGRTLAIKMTYTR